MSYNCPSLYCIFGVETPPTSQPPTPAITFPKSLYCSNSSSDSSYQGSESSDNTDIIIYNESESTPGYDPHFPHLNLDQPWVNTYEIYLESLGLQPFPVLDFDMKENQNQITMTTHFEPGHNQVVQEEIGSYDGNDGSMEWFNGTDVGWNTDRNIYNTSGAYPAHPPPSATAHPPLSAIASLPPIISTNWVEPTTWLANDNTNYATSSTTTTSTAACTGYMWSGLDNFRNLRSNDTSAVTMINPADLTDTLSLILNSVQSTLIPVTRNEIISIHKHQLSYNNHDNDYWYSLKGTTGDRPAVHSAIKTEGDLKNWVRRKEMLRAYWSEHQTNHHDVRRVLMTHGVENRRDLVYALPHDEINAVEELEKYGILDKWVPGMTHEQAWSCRTTSLAECRMAGQPHPIEIREETEIRNMMDILELINV